ncbi:MAG TPA: host attachment protein [Patescibacteria group bacterium]
MKISQKLPQFERFPALFITSGEYEAHFYVAFQGKIEEKKLLKMNPREEAKEKQGFIGHKGGQQNLASVSHHGNYIEDLKMKFCRDAQKKIRDMIAEYKLGEIYIFAPKYVAKRIMDALGKPEQKKIRMQFYKEYTKHSPLKLLEDFQKQVEEIQALVAKTPEKKNFVTLHK